MWHFNKTFSFDTIFNVIGIGIVLGGPLLVWGRAMEGRVLRVETIMELQTLQTDKATKLESDQREKILSQIKELGDKITTLQIEIAKVVAGQNTAATLQERSTRRQSQ